MDLKEDTPIYNQMQRHYALMRQTIKLEVRADMVKRLKSIKKPTKQIQDLIKEYESAETKSA